MENGSVNSLRGVLVGEKYIIALPRQGAVFVCENKLPTHYTSFLYLVARKHIRTWLLQMCLLSC